MIRAVLFDLDGTLVDSAGDLAAAVNHARRALGFPPLALATVKGYIGDGVNVLLTRAIPDPALVPRALDLFRSFYAEHLLDTTCAYAGVAAMLDALEGVPLAVVTNKTEAFSREILERLGLEARLAAIVGSDSGGGRKPDAGPFCLALERIGAPAGSSLMVGDGRNDIVGGRGAGLATCAVGWGMGLREDLRALGPDYWIDEPGELAPLVSSSPTRTSPPSTRTG